MFEQYITNYRFTKNSSSWINSSFSFGCDVKGKLQITFLLFTGAKIPFLNYSINLHYIVHILPKCDIPDTGTGTSI